MDRTKTVYYLFKTLTPVSVTKPHSYVYLHTISMCLPCEIYMPFVVVIYFLNPVFNDDV